MMLCTLLSLGFAPPRVQSRCRIITSSGAVSRRQQLDEEARQLGGKFSSVDEYVQDRLPESQQQNARRRKKEWDPSKRVTDPRDERRARKREERRVNPATTPAELLNAATESLSAAAGALGLELVGAVLARPPRGPKQAGAFRCWIESPDGPVGSAALGTASAALRDALWSAVPGQPAITVNAAGSAWPLGFSAGDFDRFAGSRVQLILREPRAGTREVPPARVQPEHIIEYW